MARRGKPSVVRVCKPDQAAQAEAVRLLVTWTVPPRAAGKSPTPGKGHTTDR